MKTVQKQNPIREKPSEKQIAFLNTLVNQLKEFEIEVSIPADLTREEASLLISKCLTWRKTIERMLNQYGSWENAIREERHKILHLQHQAQNFINVYRKMIKR